MDIHELIQVMEDDVSEKIFVVSPERVFLLASLEEYVDYSSMVISPNRQYVFKSAKSGRMIDWRMSDALIHAPGDDAKFGASPWNTVLVNDTEYVVSYP